MPGKYSVRNDTHCPAYGAAILALLLASAAHSDTPANATAATNVAPTNARATNDFPTLARVEYVQECVNRTGGDRNHMYQCVCVVDRIAETMSYDEYVEASTFARYATLPGEGGGIFRDTEDGKAKAKLFKSTEEQAFKACNLKMP